MPKAVDCILVDAKRESRDTYTRELLLRAYPETDYSLLLLSKPTLLKLSEESVKELDASSKFSVKIV